MRCFHEVGVDGRELLIAVQVVYEEGKLRLLEPLELAEHTVVQISLEIWQDDMERGEWLDQGQRSLMRVWDSKK